MALVAAATAATIYSDVFTRLSSGFDIRFIWAGLAVQPLIAIGLTVISIRHMALIGEPKVPFKAAARAMVLALGLNLLLPGRLSELIKGTYLRDHAGVPLSVGMSAIVLERTADLLILGVFGLVCVATFLPNLDYRVLTLFVSLGAAVVLFALWGRAPMSALVRVVPWPRMASFIRRSYAHFAVTVRTRQFALALALGAVAWIVSYANIFVFISLAGSLPVGFSGALVLFVFTTIGAAIPLLPGGLGTYEASAVLALRSLGYSFDEALALAIALHVAQIAMTFLLALAVMLVDRIGISSLLSELRARV